MNTSRVILAVTLLMATGCAGLSLKAAPIPESPQLKMLVDSSRTELKPDEGKLLPFNHAWSSGYCAPHAETPVFITPVDTSRVDPETLHQTFLDAEDVSELADYARKRLQSAFSEEGGNFRVVEEPPAEGRVVELTVVELSGTEVIRNVIGTALGAFVPGGGIVAARSSGTIGIEGVVKEARTGKPLLAFADRERGRTAPFSFNDFRTLSHARAAIDDWSKQVVAACAAEPGTRIPDRWPVTLLPL